MIDIASFVSSLVTGFLQLILDFVLFIVNLILSPLDFLISNFLPDLSNGLSYISSAFSSSLTYVGWIIDSSGLQQVTIILLVDYLIFKLTIPLQAYMVKLAVSWYNHLKT